MKKHIMVLFLISTTAFFALYLYSNIEQKERLRWEEKEEKEKKKREEGEDKSVRKITKKLVVCRDNNHLADVAEEIYMLQKWGQTQMISIIWAEGLARQPKFYISLANFLLSRCPPFDGDDPYLLVKLARATHGCPRDIILALSLEAQMNLKKQQCCCSKNCDNENCLKEASILMEELYKEIFKKWGE